MMRFRSLNLTLVGIVTALLFGCGRQGRNFVFDYEVEVQELPASATTVDVWIPVPIQTEHQKIHSVAFDSSVDGAIIREKVYGNHLWHARFTSPFDRPLKIRQHLEFARQEQSTHRSQFPAQAPELKDAALYLKANRMVPLTDRFLKIAESLSRDKHSLLNKGRAIYDYVLNKMSYDKTVPGWGRGDANFACDVGKGNCTDFHSLFIALCRSLKIPARFRIGFPIPEKQAAGLIGGYHCWAEFWVPRLGWVPVDISEADKHPEKSEFFFGNLDENRLAFTLGRDLILSPNQHGGPLNFFVYPYVEVDGRPWKKVDHRFSFQALSTSPANPGSQ